MPAESPARLRVGYVVKRFPRSSETFIAQEILELERRGVEISVFTLQPNDGPAPHAWLRSLRAEVVYCPQDPFRDTWDWLHDRCADDGGRDRRGTLRAIRWALESPKGRRDLSQAVSLTRTSRARRISCLHAHFANRPTVVALLAHSLAGLPFSFTAHAKDIYAAPASDANWRRFARSAEFIATVSESNRRHLVEKLGACLGRKVRRLYNGVDLDAIRPRARTPRDNTLELLCVARLVPKKGVESLLAAAAMLRERNIAFRCTIVGDGPESLALRRYAVTLGLGAHVSFEGTLSHEEVVERLGEADVFVLSSCVTPDGDRDVLPTVLLEAMAAGLPCVSTPVGGVPEIVVDGATGLLVREHDPSALADAFTLLARDPAARARMGTKGRLRAEQRFDLRQNVAVLHRWLAGTATPIENPCDRAVPEQVR